MLVIFGFGHQTFREDEFRNQEVCRHCNNTVRMLLTKKTNWFSLFFIPVIPYSTGYGKICPVCSRGIPLHYDDYMNSMNKTR